MKQIITLNECENIFSTVMTYSIYKTQQNFDLIMKHLVEFHRMTTKYLLKCINISEQEKIFYKMKNIRYDINTMIKNGSTVIKNTENVILQNNFANEEVRQLHTTIRNFRNYLFQQEVDKMTQYNDEYEEHIRTLQKEDRQQLQQNYIIRHKDTIVSEFDKRCNEFFTFYNSDIKNTHDINRIDYYDPDDVEDTNRIRMNEKYLKKYKKRNKKRNKKRETPIRQQKVMSIHELIQKLKS